MHANVMICVLFAEWSLVEHKFGGYKLVAIEDLLEQNLGIHCNQCFAWQQRDFAAICADHICVI